MAPSEKPRLKVLFATSDRLTAADWQSYAEGFSEVFLQSFPEEHFRRKYASPVSGKSYHAFLVPEANPGFIAGACTAIPFEYLVGGQKKILALIVDVFIRPAFRYDSFALRDLYNTVCKELRTDGIHFVMAVPNDVAYPFWKQIVRWTDLARIPYYILPVRVGSLLHRGRMLNLLSVPFARMWALFFRTHSYLFSGRPKQKTVRINPTPGFLEYRFPKEYRHIRKGKTDFYYRIYDEEGRRTAYLIDFSPHSPLALSVAVLHLIVNEDPDSILFIGMLEIPFNVLFRVPRRFEPKSLPLMGALISADEAGDLLLDGQNWDFGLINYDVR